MIRYVLNTLGSFRALAVGLPFLVAASAYAQDPAAAEATTDRVIVTGSYIPTAETESALPVTVYTAEVLQKQGANTPIEGLRQLPSFVGNTLTENDSNGGNGTAFINLRAIGSENTLTLINGRRAFSFADINAIPIGALSRTEVLKDGASAIYGSDAVAGVVNFILLNGPGEAPYQGAEINALYGNTTDTDAHVRHVYVRGGVTGLDGKVSIAAAGEYYSRANLFSRDRYIATTGDTSNNPTGLGFGGINNNSPTYAGRVTVAGAGSSVGLTPGARVLINLGSGGTRTPGDYRQFDPAGAGTDPSRFNFRDFTPAIPAVEKAMYFVTGRYKIFGDGLQLYGDIMYSHTKQDNALAGAPFAVPGTIAETNPATTIVTQNHSPYSPFGSFLNSVAYRVQQELGNRKSFYDSDYHRYVIGVNGDFNFKDNGFISRFGYDSGFVYETYQQVRIDSGDAQFTPLFAEIGAGNFNPFIGQSAPTSGVAGIYTTDPTTGAAVPVLNPDGTQATRAYDNTAAAQRAAYTGHSLFWERDYLYDAKVNMHLFPNLWNGGIDVAIGYEHRNIHQHQVPDPVQANGDQLGFNAAALQKFQQTANSVFTELNFPIITSTMNIPGVRSLDLAIAWRYEKFEDEDLFTKATASFTNENPDSDFGGTPRVSLRYQPIADITLRASWGQSFRSPSPSELFAPVAQNFPQVFDPLQGVTLQPPRGVWQGGNITLTPEKTDSYSAGIVWTPKFFPGFTMTADWYQIFTKDLILSGPDFAQLALTINGNSGGTAFVDPDGCGGGSGSEEAPGGPGVGVTRDEFGDVDCIDSLNSNAGKRLVQGLDVTAVYELPTERFGKFTFSGGWNHFFTWKAEPIAGAGTFSFLGNYNNGTIPLAPGAIPWNKGFLRGEWQWRGFDFVMTGNYIGDFRDDPQFDQIVRDEPRNVPSYITLDMQLSYEFIKPDAEAPPVYAKDSKDSKNVMQPVADSSTIWQRMLWGTTLRVGVVNAFDRQPPSVIGAFNDNYDTSLYSIRNRYVYVGFSKKF